MTSFPKGFIWGTSTSSHQIEGAWLEGGKGLSIWDAFSHTPGNIADTSTADTTCDHYHRFREDVDLMARLGLKAYRFSLSWPRILPTGMGKPNPEGIKFYSDLIDCLLDNDVTPWVTLYHWDLPLTLQLGLDGWLNPDLADIFANYASCCFEHFGDRVKHWITFNEPWVASILGYGQGIFAPGRTSDSEPYRVAHTMLRAHGKAAEAYRKRFQPSQNGIIGMSNNCDWREPLSATEKDRQAAERSLEFFLGWFADPVYRGDYPDSMRTRVGERLPRFTPEDADLVRGSCDFFGLNHYTTMLAAHAEPGQARQAAPSENGGIAEDQGVTLSSDPAWTKTKMGWNIVPWGCRKLLHWITNRYGSPTIVITENGCAFDDTLTDGAVNDTERVEFLQSYLHECHTAIDEGVQLKGYFLWSLMDNFEWTYGYTRRFGIHYVDFPTGRRIPKASAAWYSDVVKRSAL
jgi:beta-galactosidase